VHCASPNPVIPKDTKKHAITIPPKARQLDLFRNTSIQNKYEYFEHIMYIQGRCNSPKTYQHLINGKQKEVWIFLTRREGDWLVASAWALAGPIAAALPSLRAPPRPSPACPESAFSAVLLVCRATAAVVNDAGCLLCFPWNPNLI
jgi:hypothetical protein